MIISSTDIKNNFGKYIRLAAKEDIIITKNGKTVGKLVAYDESGNNNGKDSDFIIKESNAAYDYSGKKVSYDEFLEITSKSDERYEYIDGEIYLLASPKSTHQMLLLKMSNIFYNWFKGKKCTPAIAPYDIKLKRNDHSRNMVQPDLMVICDLEENLGEDDYYMGVPILVVEIISHSTKSKDYVKKLDLYMSCGICEYWIVDTECRETHVFLFKDKEISKNKTFAFDDEVKSFYFEHLTINLND